MAKLTEVDVIQIRNRSGSRADIADDFGVSVDCIDLIITRKRWAHI